MGPPTGGRLNAEGNSSVLDQAGPPCRTARGLR